MLSWRARVRLAIAAYGSSRRAPVIAANRAQLMVLDRDEHLRAEHAGDGMTGGPIHGNVGRRMPPRCTGRVVSDLMKLIARSLSCRKPLNYIS